MKAVNFSSDIEGRTAPKGREPNLPGDRYGRLTLLTECERQGNNRVWLVRCGCGSQTEKQVVQASIRSGLTTSCGCAQKTAATKTAKARATHGQRSNPLYSTWKHMIDRCVNPKNKRYADWGGRGISVCERWHSVENFIADMWPNYKPGMTLDRIDNNKGYEPDNCQWSTCADQNRNRRDTHWVSYKGQNVCLTDAAAIAGLTRGLVKDRITKLGWPILKALGPEFGPPADLGAVIAKVAA